MSEQTNDKSTLYEFHVRNIKGGSSINKAYVTSLVEAFGGIDSIVTKLLSSNNEDTHNYDATHIHELFENCYDKPEILTVAIPKFEENRSFDSETCTQKMKISTPFTPKSMNGEADENIVNQMFNQLMDETRKDERDYSKSLEIATAARVSYILKRNYSTIYDDEKPQEWTYCFSRNNTFLHTILGQEIGDKLFRFLYSKCIISFIFMLNFLIPFIIDKNEKNIVYILYFCICVPMQICYYLFHILSVNKRAAFLILTGFDFWFKVFYGLQFAVSFVFIYHNWSFIIGILIGIVTLLIIILLSLIDGLQLTVDMKLIFGITASIYYTVITLYYLLYQFQDSVNNKDVVLSLTDNISISMTSILSQSSQILALFFWRTTIISVIRRKKCSLISYSPFIRWQRRTV